MNHLPSPTILRALAVLAVPLAAAAAGAAPAPTLLRLEPEPSEHPTAVMRSTEQCIALVKAHDLGAAADPCQSAVVAAERERASSWSAPFVTSATDESLAVAYNNRAVLNYLNGRLSLAAADATRARHAAVLPGIDGNVAVLDAARRRAASTPL